MALTGHHHRPGEQEQQHEGGQHDQGGRQGQAVGDGRLVVGQGGRVPGDLDGERRRQRADGVDQAGGGGAGPAAGGQHLHDGDAAGQRLRLPTARTPSRAATRSPNAATLASPPGSVPARPPAPPARPRWTGRSGPRTGLVQLARTPPRRAGSRRRAAGRRRAGTASRPRTRAPRPRPRSRPAAAPAATPDANSPVPARSARAGRMRRPHMPSRAGSRVTAAAMSSRTRDHPPP